MTARREKKSLVFSKTTRSHSLWRLFFLLRRWPILSTLTRNKTEINRFISDEEINKNSYFQFSTSFLFWLLSIRCEYARFDFAQIKNKFYSKKESCRLCGVPLERDGWYSLYGRQLKISPAQCPREIPKRQRMSVKKKFKRVPIWASCEIQKQCESTEKIKRNLKKKLKSQQVDWSGINWREGEHYPHQM